MNPLAHSAPKTGGFSALRTLAPLVSLTTERNAVEDLGEAVALILEEESGLRVRRRKSRPYMDGHRERIAEISKAIRSVFGLRNSEKNSENGADFGTENSEISESENRFSPQTPLSEEEERKKRNSSSSSSSSGNYQVATKEEWDQCAKDFGIFGTEISEKAWRNYQDLGPKTVKYWRRYLSAYKANAEKSAAKHDKLAGAFSQKGTE